MLRVNAAETRFLRLDDSGTIQAAVDCLGPEGGTVVIPRWNARTGKAEWRFDRPVVLKSHATILLDNALIVQETDSFAHLFEAEEGAEKIALIGEGNACLSGGKTSRLRITTEGKFGLPAIESVSMCVFRKVSELRIENLEILDPHWFAFLLEDAKKVSVKNLRFNSYPVVPEEGGVLVHGGCQDISIENLTGRTGFDTIHVFSDHREISKLYARNILTDPARGSLVTVRTEEDGKVHDVDLSVLMDSSDFYEKARSGSCLAFGRFECPGAGSDSISRVNARDLYSRAVNAVELLQPFSETRIENLMTFGDNIYAVGTRSKKAFLVENVAFDHIYYGAGSEPNNASSFISRFAKGAKPVSTMDVSGYTVEHLYTQEEA